MRSTTSAASARPRATQYIVKLGEAAYKIFDSKQSFRLSKPYMCIVSPELRKCECYSMYSYIWISEAEAEAETEAEAGVEDGGEDVSVASNVHQNPFVNSIEYERQ